MRRVTLRTGLGVAIAALLLFIVSSRPAAAQVTILQEPDRPNGLLYSANSDQNCSELHAMADADPATLPYNVVRLTAQVTGADSYVWSLPKPQVGFLLADDDLGPQETTSAIRGFCSEFGNACLLTAKTLKFYNKPTILYAAPTCDALPKDTSKVFQGDTVTIKVAAKAGNKKLGKAATEVRWGNPQAGSVTLYANYPTNVPGVRTAKDGIGVESVEGFAITDFNAVPTPLGLPGLPPIANFAFEFAGSGGSEPSCPDDPTQICAALETQTPGTFLSTVEVTLDDGSALCDALNCQVGACPRKAQVQIIRVPSKRVYKSGDPVRLRVRFANLSPNRPGCGLLLQGANVLGCAATFKIGKSEESKSDQWDLQHCSTTTDIPCESNADCLPFGETCLDYSHCSETVARPCAGDSDCKQDVCPTCQADESCIHVLAVPELLVEPGQAVDIVDEIVPLKNEVGSPVAIKETWTANAFPGTSADAAIKYQIKEAD
jgi:hypothetical protein